MNNPPRVWLDYRPVRIGWVVSNRETTPLETMARWNACLWGGRYNCVIPAHDTELADRLVSHFAVDVLLPVEPDDATNAYINRFPHLTHLRWSESIFRRHDCEFTDIRHALRRIIANQDKELEKHLCLPAWDANDPLSALLAIQFGAYPATDVEIADYRGGIRSAFGISDTGIPIDGEISVVLLEGISPLQLTGHDVTLSRHRHGWLGPGIVIGSVTDFDALAMFWNLRAAGASLIFYDQNYGTRLKAITNAFLRKFCKPSLDGDAQINFWTRTAISRDDWKPDLELGETRISVIDGRDTSLWNGLNIERQRPNFSLLHRDVVPTYSESGGKANASFALPGRPFTDEDVLSLRQKYAVVVSARQYGTLDAEFTFETPFAPRLNEFYGRNFHFEYDAARSQMGRLDDGAVAIITAVSTQRLSISAFRVFEWMKAFFALSNISIERSEPGLRAMRLIAQLGGLRDCRVLKIRGVRNLLRKYGVDDSFTRSGAIEAIRDIDPATEVVGFDAFKNLHIEYRPKPDMKPDDVLRYLLERRVFRVGLGLMCPNCQLPSWLHLDDVKTVSSCPYCDHNYDITPQLKDRDWRYRRSGIFGRDDDQLGGVPVALTLQQLSNSLPDGVLMYSTAMTFQSKSAGIEPCESDFVAIVQGSLGMSETPVQIVFGETKTEGPIDAQDIRKLAKLADAVSRELGEAYILLSKTGKFSSAEIALARTLSSERHRRVILWSGDELEPYYLYERSREKLGDNWHAGSLCDMVRITRQLYFS
jgi:hypothetical protein